VTTKSSQETRKSASSLAADREKRSLSTDNVSSVEIMRKSLKTKQTASFQLVKHKKLLTEMVSADHAQTTKLFQPTVKPVSDQLVMTDRSFSRTVNARLLMISRSFLVIRNQLLNQNVEKEKSYSRMDFATHVELIKLSEKTEENARTQSAKREKLLKLTDHAKSAETF